MCITKRKSQGQGLAGLKDSKKNLHHDEMKIFFLSFVDISSRYMNRHGPPHSTSYEPCTSHPKDSALQTCSKIDPTLEVNSIALGADAIFAKAGECKFSQRPVGSRKETESHRLSYLDLVEARPSLTSQSRVGKRNDREHRQCVKCSNERCREV